MTDRAGFDRMSRRSLFVALLGALVGVSRLLAQDDAKEHAKNERKEQERDGRAHRRDWPMIGHDSTNTRNQPFERTIGPENVGHLALKWVATTAGDVSATPAVVNGAVYFGDFGGMVWKLDADTGKVIWSHKVSDYTGIPGDVSRSSPSLAGNTLVIGDLGGPIMIDATTGDLQWLTRLDPDPHAIMTGSPVLADHTIYVGTSQSGLSTYPGVLAALDAQTGRILWRHYSLPNPNGLPGGYWGAVMFGPPAVDREDGLVFGSFKVAAGEPAAVKACNAADPNGFNESCEQPGSYLSSIVAFDLKAGAPVWSYRVVGDVPWQRALRVTATYGDLVRPGIRPPFAGRGQVGPRRFRAQRLPNRPRQGQAHRYRRRREERRLRCPRREDRRFHLEHAHRSRRRHGRP
jgi:outer membrane protein assembly factor BamB